MYSNDMLETAVKLLHSAVMASCVVFFGFMIVTFVIGIGILIN